MKSDDGVRALVALGFSDLEARVYALLLRESPATGYRIAQAIGKAAANTYKAIESLETKGAVIVDEGESRLCRAVPPEELLGQLERRFRAHRTRALESLVTWRAEAGDDRVYQLRSREQVMERSHAMLRRCRRVALVDAFPEALEPLRGEIEAAAARGADVAVKVYRPARLARVDVVVEPRGESVLARWPGQWLNLVVDGQEHLLAFLAAEGGGVHQAVWSGSAYLSWVYHSALCAEISFAALAGRIASGGNPRELRRVLALHKRLLAPDAPGYLALARRFGIAGRTDRSRTRNGRRGP